MENKTTAASTVEKIVNAEKTAKKQLELLEEKKQNYTRQTVELIKQLEKEEYEKADAEIALKKAEFERLCSQRIEREKKNCLGAVAELNNKKDGTMAEIVQKAFDEITQSL